MSSTTLNPGSSSTPAPEIDVIAEASAIMLDGMDSKVRAGIEAEARRLRARLLSTPWYAQREKKDGGRFWVQLCLSYREPN